MEEWTYIGKGEKDLYECSAGCGAKQLPGVIDEDHSTLCPYHK